MNASLHWPEQSHAGLNKLLHEAAARGASDVHLAAGYAPAYRVHGMLMEAESAGTPLTGADLTQMVQAVLPEPMKASFGEQKNFDFSIAIEHGGMPCRFRANVYYAQGELGICLRHVPNHIPTFEWMGFPESLAETLVNHRNGLVFVTGITGSGKSTTLAALVSLLNARGGMRIITIEEPIEFVHPRMPSSIVTQREVGRDVDSFLDGLKYGLRQDPDVILVGEIRDRETARMALSAAETGHLILATLHTQDAKGAVTRFVDLFPSDAREDARTQLALSLRSVVSQHLLPHRDPASKRVLALEVLHVNNAVRSAIRMGKVDSIESAIQTGGRDGMLTFDESLARLMRAGLITAEVARRFAKDPGGLVI